MLPKVTAIVASVCSLMVSFTSAQIGLFTDPDYCYPHEYVEIDPPRGIRNGELLGHCCTNETIAADRCRHRVTEPGCDQDGSGKTISCCWNHNRRQMCLYNREYVEDSCSTEANDCSTNSTCINLYSVGQVRCVCDSGFFDVNGDGRTCVEMEECHPGSDDCTNDDVCTIVDGVYKCTCDVGYAHLSDGGDASLCVDLDECSEGTADCNENAYCTNIIGSYTCHCLSPGYYGDGLTCQEIDIYNPCSGVTFNAYIPDPTNCSRFYDCLTETSIPQSCAAGTRWDSACHCCNFAAQVPCSVDVCGLGLDRCSDAISVCMNVGDDDYRCDCIEGYENVPGTGGVACRPIADSTSTSPGEFDQSSTQTTPAFDSTTE